MRPTGGRSGPVVIGGSPSSGSTLLRVILGRHHDLRAGGELNALDHPVLFADSSEPLGAMVRRWMRLGEPRPFCSLVDGVLVSADDWGWSAAEVVQLGDSSETWGELLRRFFARTKMTQPGTRWVEKTPGNVFGFASTRREFPDAFFVHTVRDGLHATTSLMARGHSPFRAATRWYCATAAGVALTTTARAHTVRYERLVNDPDATVSALCAAIEVPFSEHMLMGDPTARPWVESWRASEYGEISTNSLAAHSPDAVEIALAHLGALRLTDAGGDLIAGAAPDSASTGWAVPPALGLLGDLEYGPYQARLLTASEKEGVRSELEGFRRFQVERYGYSPDPPTAI